MHLFLVVVGIIVLGSFDHAMSGFTALERGHAHVQGEDAFDLRPLVGVGGVVGIALLARATRARTLEHRTPHRRAAIVVVMIIDVVAAIVLIAMVGTRPETLPDIIYLVTSVVLTGLSVASASLLATDDGSVDRLARRLQRTTERSSAFDGALKTSGMLSALVLGLEGTLLAFATLAIVLGRLL